MRAQTLPQMQKATQEYKLSPSCSMLIFIPQMSPSWLCQSSCSTGNLAQLTFPFYKFGVSKYSSKILTIRRMHLIHRLVQCTLFICACLPSRIEPCKNLTPPNSAHFYRQRNSTNLITQLPFLVQSLLYYRVPIRLSNPSNPNKFHF